MGQVLLTEHDAYQIGLNASTAFCKDYDLLIATGHSDKARSMLLSTVPVALSVCAAPMRSALIAEILEIFFLIGKEVFEDGADVYELLTRSHLNES